MIAAAPQPWLLRLCLALPASILAVSAFQWLVYGFDLPIHDDWSIYNGGEAGSFALTALFRHANDTIYPFGKLLDAIAHHVLDANGIAYQFLSMVAVLGGLMVLQWRLLNRVLDDKALAAACFLLTAFMLQPGTYWGVQALAYHQALPLVGLLIILDVATNARRFSPVIVMAGLFLVGVAAGFSYISGAFAVPVAGAALLGLRLVLKRGTGLPNLLPAAYASLAAGLVTLPLQLRVVLFINAGVHRPGTPMAFPHEWDFWVFMAGKIARAAMLPQGLPLLSLIIVGILVVAFAALALRLLRRTEPVRDEGRDTALVLVTSLTAALVIYLMLVSAGRTNFRPPNENGILQVFQSGFGRFHFFWVTVLLPWVLALGLLWARDRERKPETLRRYAPVIGLACFGYATAAGVYNHDNYFKRFTDERLATIACFAQQIQNGRQDLSCPLVHPNAIENALVQNLSFSRMLRALPVAAKGTRKESIDVMALPETRLRQTGKQLDVQAGSPVMVRRGAPVEVRFGAALSLARCIRLAVATAAIPQSTGRLRVHFQRRGDTGFSHTRSRTQQWPGGGVERGRVMEFTSPTGFEPTLLFEALPPSMAAHELKSVTVTCFEAVDAPPAP
ncbi:MAG: hypothetical protein MUC58_06340 [Rhizobiaceae bacterium]|jgi:hypothetical protein|nr:hypothetical protein [Rhizobiaceae bacterium]